MDRQEAADNDQIAGSPSAGEPFFLAVGKFHRPHGIHGEILMEVLTDFPERLRPGLVVYIGKDYLPIRLKRLRTHGKGLLVELEGYPTRESVAQFRNVWVTVRADERPPLPDGEYYHHQILGLDVITDEGMALGSLVEILETGANDVYVVRQPDGSDILLPAIESVVLEIDLDQGKMIVHLIPGLTGNT